MSKHKKLRDRVLESILSRTQMNMEDMLPLEECSTPVGEFKGISGKIPHFGPMDRTCRLIPEANKNTFEIGVVTENNNGSVGGTIVRTDILNKLNTVLLNKRSSISKRKKDVCRNVCEAAELTAKDFMNNNPFFVLDTDPLAKAIFLMNEHNSPRIIVLNEKKHAVGVVTRPQLAYILESKWSESAGERLTIALLKTWLEKHPGLNKKILSDDGRRYTLWEFFNEIKTRTTRGKQFKRYFEEAIVKLLEECGDKNPKLDFLQILGNVIGPPKSLILEAVLASKKISQEDMMLVDECRLPLGNFKDEDMKIVHFKSSCRTLSLMAEIKKSNFEIGVVTQNNNGVVAGTIGRTDVLNKLDLVLSDKKTSESKEKDVCKDICDAADLQAEYFMRKDYFSVLEKDLLAKAIVVMNEKKSPRIIILDDKKHDVGLIVRENLAIQLQNIWAQYLNVGLGIAFFKHWLKNHPAPDKKTFRNSTKEYSSRDVLAEMESGTRIGNEFKRDFEEMIGEILESGYGSSKDIGEIISALTKPPNTLD